MSVENGEALVEWLSQAQCSSVLVCPGSEFALEHIVASCKQSALVGLPVGFVAAWLGPSVADGQLAKLSEFSWGVTTGSLLWSLDTWHVIPHGRGGLIEVLPVDDQLLVERLATPRRFVGLVSHGNGIDVAIPEGVFCALADERTKRTRSSGWFLPCGVEGGPCLRSKPDGAGAIQPPPRFSPSVVAADVVVWHTCLGLLADGSLFDKRRSLVASLLRSPHTGAVITTALDVPGDLSVALLALALMDEGASLGSITMELNRLAMSSSHGMAPWLLLGDPEVAIQTSAGAPLPLTATPRPVRVPSGVTRVVLDGSGRRTITAIPGRAARAPLDEGTLVSLQVGHSRHGLVLNLNDDEHDVELRARKYSDVPEHRVVDSILGSAPGLEFAREVLDKLSFNERAAACDVPDALPARVESSLARTMATDLRRRRLGGYESRLRAVMDDLLADWVELHRELVEFAVSYTSNVGTLTSLNATRFRRISELQRTTMQCPHCERTVTSQSVGVPLTGSRRVVRWCPSRCAFLSDTDARVAELVLTGPDQVVRGRPTPFELRLSWDQSPGWHYLHMKACLERTPWLARARSTEFVTEASSQFTSATLTVTVDQSVPLGVYFLVGIVAAQGDLWTCRRPILVRDSGP